MIETKRRIIEALLLVTVAAHCKEVATQYGTYIACQAQDGG